MKAAEERSMARDNLIQQLRDEAGRLLVRRVINRNDWISDAVFNIAAGDRTVWNKRDWAALINDLAASSLMLTDWLDLNT